MKKSITLIVNTLTNIYIPSSLHEKYASSFYDDQNVEIFNILFRELIEQRLNEI